MIHETLSRWNIINETCDIETCDSETHENETWDTEIWHWHWHTNLWHENLGHLWHLPFGTFPYFKTVRIMHAIQMLWRSIVKVKRYGTPFTKVRAAEVFFIRFYIFHLRWNPRLWNWKMDFSNILIVSILTNIAHNSAVTFDISTFSETQIIEE